MSVADNVLVGRHIHMRSGFFACGLPIGPAPREEKRHRMDVDKILGLLNLRSIRSRPVENLPYGIQKRVELARALVAAPKLLLLDEPMAGMGGEDIQRVAAVRGAIGEPVSAMVVGDDPQLIRQRIHLLVPQLLRAGPAVDEHQGRGALGPMDPGVESASSRPRHLDRAAAIGRGAPRGALAGDAPRVEPAARRGRSRDARREQRLVA